MHFEAFFTLNPTISIKSFFIFQFIQNIKNIPQIIKEKYKIVWEIPMKDLIEMAKDRGAFICQSQSFNVFMKKQIQKLLIVFIYMDILLDLKLVHIILEQNQF
mgnify:CR=1 FL=1